MRLTKLEKEILLVGLQREHQHCQKYEKSDPIFWMERGVAIMSLIRRIRLIDPIEEED